MLDQETRALLIATRDGAAADGISARFALHRERSHLMRIGNNSVSLNTSETLTRLDVEVTDGRREGSHTRVGDLRTAGDVEAPLQIAVENAAAAKEKDYAPLVAAVEESIEEQGQYDPALADLDPAHKADVYRRIISEVGEQYNYSGSWSSGSTELYVVTAANENEAWHLGTDQRFSLVVKHPELKWELSHDQTGWRAGDVTADKTIEHLRKLLDVYERSEGAQVEPGDYTVLFGPRAIADILTMTMWTGLVGRSWEEKQSWTADRKPGDRVLGENVSLADDPESDLTFGFSFDYCGHRRARFPLIEEGKLSQLMYDSATAAKYGRDATGHDIYSPSIVMRPGDGPAEPMQAAKGHSNVLYIPALHYMNVPNRSRGIFTGSSRFSAVLVDDGEIQQPIFSTRITDSLENVLGSIRALSPRAVSVNTSQTYGRRSPVAMEVPSYMLVEGVKITDSAESF